MEIPDERRVTRGKERKGGIKKLIVFDIGLAKDRYPKRQRAAQRKRADQVITIHLRVVSQEKTGAGRKGDKREKKGTTACV